MKRHWMVVVALSVLTFGGAVVDQAAAQRTARSYYQNNTPAMAGPDAAQAADGFVEELPTGGRPTGQMPHGDPQGFAEYGAQSHGHYSGMSPGYGCDGEGPCQTCGDPSCDGGCCCDSLFVGAPPGQFYVTVDYLHVRSTFSEATAFVEVDTTQQNLVVRNVHQLDFDYESSYRIGAGYRLCGCGDEIRFLYTRLQSGAETEVGVDTDIFVPYEPGMPPGGMNVINADVDVNSYDIEFAKTIPLGGECECGCDPCDGCCPPQCPAWDITWSGGIRIADAGWERNFIALDAAGDPFGNAFVEMDFQGAGAKVGLEGRRYFGNNGWFSLFLKGDISLLLGDLDILSVRTANNGTVTRQSFNTTNIIPVTEIELGGSGQVTCNSRLSAGYMLSAWHDLGFRDEFEVAAQPVFPVSYDDANILGFDGFFARFEWAY